MKPVCINMSGHPLHPDTVKEVKGAGWKKIVDVPVENVDMTPTGVVNAAKKLVEGIMKNCGENIKTGEYIIIPPGLAPLSISVIAILHGIGGHFPRIGMLARNEEGRFAFIGVFDPQQIREEYRNFR